MVIKNPSLPGPYYDRLVQTDGSVLNWARLLFRPGFALQSAELNEMQTLVMSQFEKLTRQFYKDGAPFYGISISTTAGDPDGIDVAVTAGRIYALGHIHDVPAGTCHITGVGKEIVYLKISKVVLTASPSDYVDAETVILDNTLKDPAIGSENYQYASADRMILDYSYVVNENTGIPVATFIDGILQTPQESSNILDWLFKILAQRTFEQSGHFQVNLPALKIVDVGTPSTNPGHLSLEIDGGLAYINGYRRDNSKCFLSIKRTMDGADRVNEPETFNTGTKVYSLDNPTLLSLDTLTALLQSPVITMTRGGVVGGQDAIPVGYQPTDSIVLVTQGVTTFTQGTDYTLAGNFISWAPGGAEPATGSTYSLTVKYTKNLTKAIRTRTRVTAEAKTVTGGEITLAHSDIAEIILWEKSDHSVAYVETTNYTINKGTGVLTVVGGTPANTTATLVTYDYWAHTVEGDFVSRDSFVDADGNQLPYVTPTKTPTGVTVDYTRQISFDVTAGKVPVNSSTFLMDYKYALGRVDTLVWHKDGAFEVLNGVPGVVPAVPTLGAEMMPIANFRLPSECFAADVTVERYDNQTLEVTDLRRMLSMIKDLQYDVGRFQLQQKASDITTPTDKRGIFADNLSTPELADINNPDFAGTFDFLAHTFSLPREHHDVTVTLSSSTATKKEDMWITNYTEATVLAQPYASTNKVINAYGAVNTRSKVVINPAIDTTIKSEVVAIKTTHADVLLKTGNVKNTSLMTNISPSLQVAKQLNTKSTSIKPKKLRKIPVDREWLSVLEGETVPQDLLTSTDTTTVTDNQWEKILSATQTVIEGEIEQRTITATGSFFTANERAISCTFNSEVIPLTATGGTVAETDPDFPGCVKADANGNFTATFVVPAGTKSGVHVIEFIGHDPDDFGRVISYSKVNYTATSYLEQQALFVTLANCPNIKESRKESAYALCAALGLGNPDKSVLRALNGPIAYTVAYALIQAQNQGVTVTRAGLKAAIAAAVAYTSLVTVLNVTKISAIGDAASLTSLDAIANGNAIIAAEPLAQLPLQRNTPAKPDPLAQTFKLDGEDRMVTSVGVYFGVLPAAEPVCVAIATVVNGIPTDQYLATKWLNPDQCVLDSNGTTPTWFTFAKPVYMAGDTDYAFVVITDDTVAALKIAVTGGTDPINGLIVKNPSAGVLLESANSETWQPVSSADLKFAIRCAEFTTEESILTFGTVTLPENLSILNLNVPFVEPNENTNVTYQYSLDNVEWRDFAPLLDLDLQNAVGTVYLRLIAKGTSTMCPVIVDAPRLSAYIYETDGAYVHRQFSLNDEEAEDCDLWVITRIPGSTTITAQVQFDDDDYEDMDEEVGDRQQIDQNWMLRHYTYNTGGPLKTDVRVKILLHTSATYVTPSIMDPIVIAR